MAKAQNKSSDPMDNKNYKDKKALVGRVRKVVKKTQRKLGEEKFEKELQRTIGFLTELRDKLTHNSGNSVRKITAAKPQPKAPAKPTAKVATKAAAKTPAKPGAKVSVAAPIGAKTAKKS
jgi:hypothetical protein